MAVLTASQLIEIQRDCERHFNGAQIPINYVKSQLKAAAQAIENVFESAAFKNAISSAIDTATAPLVLTVAQKKALVKYWLRVKFNIE